MPKGANQQLNLLIVPSRFPSLLHFLKSERGNVESAMVIIPLLFLFLISAQLIVVTNLRNMQQVIAQGDASSRALTGIIESGDEVIAINSPDSFAHLKLLITHHRQDIIQLIPGFFAIMGGMPQIDVKGAAVMENSQ